MILTILLILFCIIFIFFSLAHLFASYIDDKTQRARTKWGIVPSLGFIYVLASKDVNVLFLLALLFCFLGDVFLIKKSRISFILGGFSFLFAHIFFILTYCQYTNFANIPLWVIPIVCAIYIAVVFWGLRKPSKYVKTTDKVLFYTYLSVNAVNSIFALLWLISNPNVASVIAFLGATSFIISDTLLFRCRFLPHSIKRKHFYVMLTYIFAEELLVAANLLAESL